MQIAFILFVALKYLARLYCICIVWNNSDTNQIIDIDFDGLRVQQNFPTWIQLKYAFDENRTNVDDLVRLGIDNGCQVKENMKIGNFNIF